MIFTPVTLPNIIPPNFKTEAVYSLSPISAGASPSHYWQGKIELTPRAPFSRTGMGLVPQKMNFLVEQAWGLFINSFHTNGAKSPIEQVQATHPTN